MRSSYNMQPLASIGVQPLLLLLQVIPGDNMAGELSPLHAFTCGVLSYPDAIRNGSHFHMMKEGLCGSCRPVL